MYSSPDIFQVIMSKKIRSFRHVTSMAVKKMCIGFRCGDLKKRNCCEAVVINGRVILQLNVTKLDGRFCSGLLWLVTGASGRPL
jgi:hypothetical protein